MPNAIPNEMILASAGSGKTWQLTNRFIALMGRQLLAGEEVTPERIVAVTFTRKAAGEFFDSILVKLARAASDPAYAEMLVGDESLDPEARHDPLRPILSELGPGDYRQLLRVFISRMPRLFLGTLDSFFASILRSFPAEFGLAGDFEILSDHLGAVERERVYRQVFQRALPGLKGRAENLGAQQDFLEAFRRATFGKEESSIRHILDQFVETQHEILLHAAREELWGNPHAVWPKGCRWLGAEDVDLKAEFDRLFEVFSSEGLGPKEWEYWDQFRDQAVEHVPGNALPGRVKFFLDKLLPKWAEVEAEDCEIVVNRQKQRLGAEACEVVNPIITHLVGAELRVRLERTHGVWEVLSLFEEYWSRQVRRRGRLTFQDMELILAGHEFAAGLPRPMLSQVPGPDDRLRIDYRLDARYDHWLLDEFQDTNHLQWSVIENLIDEAVQDVSEQRTLFQVGDVKQAIYAWRGGDTRLFHDIFSRYNSGVEKRIVARPLNVSWRSGHDVIEMVNRAFGSSPALNALEIPDAALQRWQWRDHSVAGIHSQLPGHAVLIEPLPADGEKVTREDRYTLTVGILEEIQPVSRGLSCAILVQDNRTGREIVDHIRAHSPSRIPVMSESEISPATDNALTLALLSLIKVAAHPGDTLAWQHLRMTPFRALLEDSNPGKLSSEVLRQIFDEGFEAVLRHWLHELETVAGVAIDPFSRHRVEDVALAARLFDRGGSRDVDEFLAYASSYTVREPDTRNAVQVMTIHKSKGLTFDCVILPDVEGQALTAIRRGIGVKRNRDRRVEWVFDLPPSEIVRADPVLARHRVDREAEAAYEELCKFYVALTRAKHANYVIAEPRSDQSKSNNFVKLLHETLDGVSPRETREFGGVAAELIYQSRTAASDPRWFEQARSESSANPGNETPAAPPPITAAGRQRPVRRTPSGSETSIVTARQLFSSGGRFARAYGTLVHALFEQVEWIDELDDTVLAARWSAVPCPDPSLRARAEDEVRRCLAAQDCRALLCRHSPKSECWREKRFEIVLNGEWLSGTFDRVSIEPDWATIIDFKTDKTDTDEAFAARVAGYRPQLETYREVLSRMTGLSRDRIACRLLFTHRTAVVEI
jgi:ATP-dependent helicase/nuclease subunit A